MAKIEGTWPENDLRRAFVEGAEWWNERVTGEFTTWRSEDDLIEKEAEKRYGSLPVDRRRSESEIREELKKLKVDARNGNFFSGASAMVIILKWVLNEEDGE